MDLNSLNAKDLTEANIGNFLAEFENALNGSDYSKVKKAIEQINSFLVSPGIINVTRSGDNMMDVTSGGTTESVNIEKIAQAIVERIKADYESRTVTGTAAADRDAARDEMNKFLTSMFNQDKLMEELAERGFSIEEFYRQMDRLNDESRVTIETLKKEKNEKNNAFEAVFGGDSTIKTGDYLAKAYPTRIKDCQEAIATLEISKKELTSLEQARSDRAAATTNAEKTRLDGEIARHEVNLKMLGNKVAELKILGIDSTFFGDWETETKIASTLSNIDSVNAIAKCELDKSYVDMKMKIAALNDIERAKLGITDAIKDCFDKIDDMDPDIKKNSRLAVDTYLKDMQKTINFDIPGKITMEERMIALREENVQKYREIQAKVVDVQSRVSYQMINEAIFFDATGNPVQDVDGDGNPAVDENGNPIFIRTQYVQAIDPNTGLPIYEGTPPTPKFEIDPSTGNPRTVNVPATRNKRIIDPNTGDYVRDADGNFVIELDGAGNPVQEPVFAVVNDRNTRNYYLQKAGYNKEQALDRIDNQLFTRKEIRAVLKNERVGNPISRFFAPKRLWKRSCSRANFLKNYENGLIELEERKEYEEVMPEKRSINALSHIFERVKNSAIVQHMLYSAGKEQGFDSSSVDKSALVSDLERAAYEEAFDRGAYFGADEINAIRKSKGDTHENLVKRHTKGTQSSASDLVHKDDNNDMEL